MSTTVPPLPQAPLPPPPAYLGRQIVAEFYGCPPERLTDVAGIEKTMNDAARACGATIVNSVFHLFNPHGVSGAVIIAESHLAIHTWPEYGYAAVDVFTCGDSVDPNDAVAYLATALESRHHSLTEMKRGNVKMLRAQRSVEARS